MRGGACVYIVLRFLQQVVMYKCHKLLYQYIVGLPPSMLIQVTIQYPLACHLHVINMLKVIGLAFGLAVHLKNINFEVLTVAKVVSILVQLLNH